MKPRPKLELEKILDILYKIKDDVFYFKEYGKDLISSYIKQEQDNNKFSEEDMIEASKYGYNFHKTTQFPNQEFEDSCIRNTQQWVQYLKRNNYGI